MPAMSHQELLLEWRPAQRRATTPPQNALSPIGELLPNSISIEVIRANEKVKTKPKPVSQAMNRSVRRALEPKMSDVGLLIGVAEILN